MTEEEKPEGTTEEKPQEKEEGTADADPTDLIDKANQAAERLENANKELAKLIAVQQKTHVEKTLSGTATAGVASLTKEEKEIAAAKAFLKGTGMDDYAFPEP